MVQDQDWVLQLLAPEVFNHHHPGRRGHCGNIFHVLLKCSIVLNNGGIELEMESDSSSKCTKKALPSMEWKMYAGVQAYSSLEIREITSTVTSLTYLTTWLSQSKQCCHRVPAPGSDSADTTFPSTTFIALLNYINWIEDILLYIKH